MSTKLWNSYKILCDKIFTELNQEGNQVMLKISNINSFRQVIRLESAKIDRKYSVKRAETGNDNYIIKFEYIKTLMESGMYYEQSEIKLEFKKIAYHDAKQIIKYLKVSEYCKLEVENVGEFRRYLTILCNNTTPRQKYSVNIENINTNECIVRRIK